MYTIDDIELIKDAQNGSSKAFGVLADRHYEMVYRTAYRWRPYKEDAEDITQDVFVKLAKSINDFRGESSFKTWLYRVTMNSAKDFGRKTSNKHKYEEKFVEENLRENNNTEETVEQQPSCTDSNSAVFKAIDRLSDKLKDALILVVSEELSHKEASTILKCSVATVAWRVFEAKKRLKKVLEKKL